MDVEIPHPTTSLRPAVQTRTTTTDGRTCYHEEGYAIRAAVVPHDLIDRLLESLRKDIVPSRDRFYRQSTGRYEANRFTKHGYLDNALIDPHDFRRHRSFSQRALELVFCEPLLAEMERLTGHSRMQLLRTMLVDANPKTPPHQDWWYPDAIPNGNLIAAWIALEDIDERAGRFYVMRDSSSMRLHEELKALTHRERLTRLAAWEREHEDRMVAPALKKGDVLFWNSSTIHGSLPTQDGRFSRKSVSAHYLPEGAEFSHKLAQSGVSEVKEFRGYTFYKNRPDYSRLDALRPSKRYPPFRGGVDPSRSHP